MGSFFTLALGAALVFGAPKPAPKGEVASGDTMPIKPAAAPAGQGKQGGPVKLVDLENAEVTLPHGNMALRGVVTKCGGRIQLEMPGGIVIEAARLKIKGQGKTQALKANPDGTFTVYSFDGDSLPSDW